MKTTGNLVTWVGFLGLAFASLGAQCRQEPPQAPEPLTLTVKVPKLVPVEQGTETQEKGGVVIQMAPVLFEVERSTETTCTEKPTLIMMNNQKSFEIKETPKYSVRPETLNFKLKVVNRLERVLKLEGSIFKLNVAGSEVALDQAGYKSFVSGILTPKEEKEYVVTGPVWSSLPNDATLAFSIYDVPIEMDEAGTITKKGNFEWTFKYQAQEQAKNDQVTIRDESMTRERAASICPGMPAGPPAASEPPKQKTFSEDVQ